MLWWLAHFCILFVQVVLPFNPAATSFHALVACAFLYIVCSGRAAIQPSSNQLSCFGGLRIFVYCLFRSCCHSTQQQPAFMLWWLAHFCILFVQVVLPFNPAATSFHALA